MLALQCHSSHSGSISSEPSRGEETSWGPVEESLSRIFFLDILGEEGVKRRLWNLLSLSAKCAGVEVPDPMVMLDVCNKILKGIIEHLVESLMNREPLSYRAYLLKCRVEVKKNRVEQEEGVLDQFKSIDMSLANRRIERANLVVFFLTVVLDFLNDTTLSSDKIWENLRLSF